MCALIHTDYEPLLGSLIVVHAKVWLLSLQWRKQTGTSQEKEVGVDFKWTQASRCKSILRGAVDHYKGKTLTQLWYYPGPLEAQQ